MAANPDLIPASVLPEDVDAEETNEWLDALQAVIETEGIERAHYLIERLVDEARRAGANLPYSATTAYINTIPAHREMRMPGDSKLEHKIRSYVRWNAMAMVVKANQNASELGGHISSFASSATLYDVGFNHFFHARDNKHGGDLVFFQGHSAPGIYARAYVEGVLSEAQLLNFRQEVEPGGLSSYPHPWLMPDFWQFPTVSMGLGPIMAIYQARFMRYLQGRKITDTDGRKVWAFLGDGECDEPESMGAIGMAGREKLDNLIFVINCNLQRLDGPVRGDGKIIQELEGSFRGAGWNVIKVVWGSYWDALFAKDKDGWLQKRMEEAVDGDYQTYKSKDGAYIRKHFFGKYPELLDMVANLSDDDIYRLNRGGHDPFKVYAAYAEAVKHTGQPTVILAKTVKGYGTGKAGEATMDAHNLKKMNIDALKAFRDRFHIPVTDEDIADLPFYKPADDSPEMQYLQQRRAALGGHLPQRLQDAPLLQIPDLDMFDGLLKSSGEREMSTTMAFVRMISTLLRDKKLGKYIVPIVADEARTFGMEGLFKTYAIYSSVGQLFEEADKGSMMSYREAEDGQIMEEGICEAGAMSSWIAAGTAYSHHETQMIPFYIFYSMFGFQRIGDLIWAGADMQARGFLLGGTAGRTTLNGEGLQHQDGNSHLIAGTVPNCISYDPTFAYELAVIVHDGLRRMYQEGERIFYYITVMNENYAHPEMPKNAESGIIKGMYRFSKARKKADVQLMGSGTILREVIAAAGLLQQDFNLSADIWSVTSYNEVRREAEKCQRWNRLHPDKKPKISYLEQCLSKANGPIVASSDYVKALPESIRFAMPRTYTVLGTDGFGRSDSREQLRAFFEVDRYHIVLATLKALVDEGDLSVDQLQQAINQYGIDPEKPNPITV